MAKALGNPPDRMTVDEFLAWLDEGPEGARYELVAGDVVAMVPECAAHARRKAQVWLAFAQRHQGSWPALRGARTG
jgi:Uma2 family endonuclease